MCCLAVFVECWGLAWGLVVWIGLLPSGIVVVDDMVGSEFRQLDQRRSNVKM